MGNSHVSSGNSLGLGLIFLSHHKLSFQFLHGFRDGACYPTYQILERQSLEGRAHTHPWGGIHGGILGAVQDLDTTIPVGPFQLGIFCDSMIISSKNRPSGNIKPLTFTHPSHSTPLLRMWKAFLNLREQHPPSKLLSSLLGAIKAIPGTLWQEERCLQLSTSAQMQIKCAPCFIWV